MVLTGPAPFALIWLTSRCGLAVQGQWAFRWLSHSSRNLTGELIDWAGPADGEPVAKVDVVEEEFSDGFAAGGVHRGQDQAPDRCCSPRSLPHFVPLSRVRLVGTSIGSHCTGLEVEGLYQTAGVRFVPGLLQFPNVL
jgi:hypothetical protein